MNTPETPLAETARSMGNLLASKQGEVLNDATQQALRRLLDADSVRDVAASQIELLSRFYGMSLDQADRSFFWALIASIIGFVLFIVAIGLAFTRYSDAVMVSALAGAMVQFIAGVNFFLYSKTLSLLSLFQSRLEATQRFLLANSLCESLENERVREYTRSRLIGTLAGVSSGDTGFFWSENQTGRDSVDRSVEPAIAPEPVNPASGNPAAAVALTPG